MKRRRAPPEIHVIPLRRGRPVMTKPQGLRYSGKPAFLGGPLHEVEIRYERWWKITGAGVDKEWYSTQAVALRVARRRAKVLGDAPIIVHRPDGSPRK